MLKNINKGIPMLKIGDQAPLLTLPNQDNVEISLRDLEGKWVVLYFYPKDSTPGCTTEACDFTAALPAFEDLNAVRTLIFNSLDEGEIRESTKDKLLKDLYRSASIKGIFFVRVIERKTQDLPKTPEEEAELEEEESYEESYELFFNIVLPLVIYFSRELS